MNTAILLLAAALPAFLAAQENPLATDHAGSWKTPLPVPIVFRYGLPAAERPLALATSARLFDILRRMPEMTPPPGFEVVPQSSTQVDSPDHAPDNAGHAWVQVNATIGLVPWEHTPQGVAPWERDTAGAVMIRSNDLQPFTGAGMKDLTGNWVDADGLLLADVREPDGAVHGYPMYDVGNGDTWVLMSRNKVPVLAPVPRQRYMTLFLRNVQASIDNLRKRRPGIAASGFPGVADTLLPQMDAAIANYEKVLSEAQAQFAAMSPQERAAPTVLAGSPEDAPQFAADSSGGRAILCINPALMDPKLPRTAVQILFIQFSSNEDIWPGTKEKLERDLDWDALQKLLDEPR